MRFKLLGVLGLCTILLFFLVETALAQVVQQNQPITLTTAGQTYRLQNSLRFTGNGIYIAAPNVTLDLNGHTIYYGGNDAANAHGVLLYINGYHSEISIPGASTPTNAKIINGSIVHEGTGATSHGIYSRRAHDATIQNMRVEVYGMDTHTVYFQYYNATIRDSVLISHANGSFDRHAGPANVFLGETLTAFGNVLVGGNSGFNVNSGSRITKNVIQHDSHVTNGYGVFLYRNENVLVEDNIMIPSNGRGVIMNAGENHQIIDNVILHLESPNAEFGDSLNPPAIRARYETINLSVRGNVGLGIGGGDRTSASSIYLSPDGQAQSIYENNSMTTILAGNPDITHYAQPLTVERLNYDVQSKDIIRNNVFRSNMYFLRTNGYDGAAGNNLPWKNNSLVWVDGNTARTDFMAAVQTKLQEIGLAANSDAIAAVQRTHTLINNLIGSVPLHPQRKVWFTKHYSGDEFATALDFQYGPGVLSDSYAIIDLYQGVVSLRVGKTLRARALGNAGAPLANTTIILTTDKGDTYTQTSDASGLVDLPIIEFGLDKASAQNAPIVKNARNTSTFAVTGFPSITEPNPTLLGAVGGTYTLRFGGGTSTRPNAPSNLRVLP